MRLSQIEGFFHALEQVNDPSGVLSVLTAFTVSDRISGTFVARLPSPDESMASHVLLRGWNPDWIEEYAEKNYQRDDPIAKELLRRNAPYVWSEVCTSRKLNPAEQSFMRKARSAGLENGLTVPVLDASLGTTCVSFATSDQYQFDPEGRQALQAVASMTVAKLDVINPRQAAQPPVDRLAPREIQCLSLAGKGLTSRQIERQTGLSFRTVDFYIGRAMQKLGAHSRTEALHLAELYRMIN